MIKIAQGALGTVVTLFGGLLIGLVAGDLTFKMIPGSSVENVRIGHAAIAAVPALLGFLASGAFWGAAMGRLAGITQTGRMAKAGLLGFAPITIVLAVGLGVAEPVILELIGDRFPIHRVFTLLFVPSAFLIAGSSAYAVGRGLRKPRLAWTLFWRTGLAAAAAFLLVNMAMEASGWVVGAPRAAESLTMLVVMFSGNLAAALVGGGQLGYLLDRHAVKAGGSLPVTLVGHQSH